MVIDAQCGVCVCRDHLKSMSSSFGHLISVMRDRLLLLYQSLSSSTSSLCRDREDSIVTADQTHCGCIISKLVCVVLALCCPTVMGKKCEQRGTEHTALRDSSVQKSCAGGPVSYPDCLGSFHQEH